MHRSLLRSALAPPAVAVALALVAASVADATVTPVHSATTTTATRQTSRSSRDVARLVRVRVLPADPTIVGSDAARGRRRRPKPPPGSTCAPTTPPNASYVLEGWKVSGPLTFHFNPATTPSDVVNPATTLQAAFRAWSAVGAPAVSVASDGQTTGPVADHVDEVMFAALDGSTLGVTDTWQWSDGSIESDTVLNSSAPYFQPASEGTGCYNVAAYDLQSVATHEFGHVFGLDHSPSDPAATMYPSAGMGETFKRSPDQTDDAGIRALYG